MGDHIRIEGNMGEPIRIGGAIDLDNEFIRKYTESMDNFFKRSKPFPKDSVIEKHLVPHVYVSFTEDNIPKNTINANIPVHKKRKTRKRKE